MANDGTLTVRVATQADADSLARLRFAWRTTERGEHGLAEPSFVTAFAAWMEDHRATHTPFLALREGDAIGMAWLAVVDRVPGPQYFTRRSAYIQSVFVVADERSAGVGTALMDLVLEHARGLGLDYLAVHPSDRAFALYRRLGFTESDRVLERRD